jgi:dipeptidyl aminopeptidase/acylaminoacyl peptidase
MESVSPLYHLDSNSPPVFTEHGTADSTVPYEQSVKLYEKLKANGIKAELISIEGGGHGKFYKE